MSGNFLLIYICNFHVLNHFLLIYICKLNWNQGDVRGLVPRSAENIFQNLVQRASTYEVAMVVSFLEIYNDQIRDLGKAYLVAMGVESSTSSALYEKVIFF
jgi:Kinesin motor domain